MKEKCQSDGKTYLSMPPQHKCMHCYQWWVIGSEPPLCGKKDWQRVVYSRDNYEVWKIPLTGEEFKLPMALIETIKKTP